MTRRLRGALAGAVIVSGLALAPSPASATDGNLYAYGASDWARSAQVSATILSGTVWQISAPAMTPAAINHWEMHWVCPVAGSEVAAVLFGALRTAPASSLALQVTGDRRVLWSEGDTLIPQSPAGGRGYDVRLPGGQCDVHLALAQLESRPQHARTYFIDSPRILVRDVSAPTVTLRGVSGGWLNGATALAVSWSAADNFGADGIGQQRVIAGGQVLWAGAAGQGDHAVSLAVNGLGDGVHRVEVQADGDGTGAGAAAGSVSIDRTAPTADQLSAAPTETPGAVRLAWRVADNLSGVTSSEVEVNRAADGVPLGEWTSIAVASGPGAHEATVGSLRVPDGVHAWRVRTTDAAGNVATTPAPDNVIVDTTAPEVTLHPLATGWVRRADVDLTATDNLQAALGLGSTEVDLNAATDGGETGKWIRRSTNPGVAGRRTLPIDVGGLGDGRHAVRLTVRNGGPSGVHLWAERRSSLRVDLTNPVVTSAVFSGGGSAPITAAWVSDDATSGVATVTVQWRDGAAWRTLAGQPARNGPGRMTVDGSAIPDGARSLRVVIADAAGNVAARTGDAVITGTSADMLTRLQSSRLELAVPGARREKRGDRVVLVRRILAGDRMRVTGRLLDDASRGIVGVEIQARGYRGQIVARALTRAGGVFAMEGRPLAGSPVRIGVSSLSGLLPARPTADVRVEVRPRIALAASRARVAAGGRVIFSGRLSPSSKDLGIRAPKGVVLEWLDPVRRTWRPVVNARLRPDGTFAVPWNFGVAGLTIPFRVAVPPEVGWPQLGARSRVVRVRVEG